MKIMQLIEESCIASSEGDYKKGLVKAKEASNKERSLIRMQEQSGLGDHHNMDLTYSVSEQNYKCTYRSTLNYIS